MLKLAVIGKDVSASTSPAIHSFIAAKMGNAIEYSALSVPEEEFDGRIGGILSEYDGLNVTIPYKLAIMPRLKKIVGDAAVFGAVNTVRCGELIGDNTDGAGFSLMLENSGVDAGGKKVLLLGAGGAGRSVAKKLLDAGAEVEVFDKRAENVRALAREFAGIKAVDEVSAERRYMIVNATGVGMHRSVGQSPVGEDVLRGCSVAVDLIYTPKVSRFLEIAASLGKKTLNGSGMLFYQAYFAECVFFGLTPDKRQAKELFEEYIKEDRQ